MEVRERYQRVSFLGEPTRARLLELVAALADDGEFEEPGDPGAPPFYYCVAVQASDTLGVHAGQVLEELGQVMRAHPIAAQQGVRLLPGCGEAGVSLLLETLQSPHVWGRRAAVQEVRAQLATTSAEGPLVTALFEALADPDSEVTYNALSSVRTLLAERPEAVRWAAPSLVDRLVARMRAEPAAGTYAEVLKFCADRAGVAEAWLDLAVEGAGVPAGLLRGRPLSDADVHRLCQGRLSPELINLLGDLGPRAREAAPRLRELLPAPGAAMALARMGVEVDLAGIFLDETDYRVQEQLVLSCADPKRLAEQVLPRLRQRWESRAKDRNVLWAVGAFREHAVSELPWLLELLTPYGEWCSSVIRIVSWFGAASRPAFPALARLLDHNDQRGPVLKALSQLGPVARDDFLPLLEVLELESERWLVWQRNWWTQPLREALRALRG